MAGAVKGAETGAVLVISGTDTSGGAGMQQDVRALHALGVQGRFVVTAVTAQGKTGVSAVQPISPKMLQAQIEAAVSLGPIAAIKIGMLGSAAVIEAVAPFLPDAPIILDPVLKASAGGLLLDREGEQALRRLIWPRARLVTPNLPEAAYLLSAPEAQSPAAMRGQAAALLSLGAPAVLLKGGHLDGDWATDLLTEAGKLRWFKVKKSPGSMRGTGCLLSTAIAAGLAQGKSLPLSIAQAKRLIGRFMGGA
jgi:hydroxymethylpyrimidine/phosphomethylpyrimidine kinase